MLEYLGLLFFVVYFYIFRKAIDEITQWDKIKDEVRRRD